MPLKLKYPLKFILSLLTLTTLFGYQEKDSLSRKNFPLPEDAEIVDINNVKRGGIFVLAHPQPPRTFNPLVAEDTYSLYAFTPLLGSLMNYDWVKQELIPGLAKNWQISKDYLTYTFYLRKGIKWSDGTPFTAEDVIFTFDAIYDPRYPNRYENQLTFEGKKITYRKIDDFTIEFTTPDRYASSLKNIGTIFILPKHKLFEAYNKGDLQEKWSLDAPVDSPKELVSLGPFMIQKFTPGESLVFEPNPHYWKVDQQGSRLPYIDIYIHKYVPDKNTQTILFATGEVDAAELAPKDLPWVKKNASKYGFRIYDQGPAPRISFMWFNLKKGKNKRGEFYLPPHKLKWFENTSFRQAIAYALDRKGMVEALLDGKGQPLHTIASPANKKWFNSETKKYPLDISQSKALLLAQGFYYDKTGKLFDEADNPVTFELMGSENGNSNKLATTIKENLTQIGIEVKLSLLDFGTLVERTGSSFKYEAAMMAFGEGDGEPSGGKAVYKSNGRMHIWNPEQPSPATSWEKEIDTLFDLQEKEMDETRRIALFKKIQEIFSEEVPLIFLITPNSYVGIQEKWHPIKPSPLGGILWNIDEIGLYEKTP